MTAQMRDFYRYRGEEYIYIAKTNDILFDPKVYGVNPKGFCSACWKCFWSEYDIKDNGLELNTIHIYNDDGNYPEFNGIKAAPLEYHEVTRTHFENGSWVTEKVMTPTGYGFRKYVNVSIPIEYTGKILLGRGYMNQ